jgi:hypothetical protein
MVQPRDRHERAARLAGHDLFRGEQSAAHDVGRGFEHAAKRGRVARIQIALARRRTVGDQIDVLRGVEGQQLIARGRARFHEADVPVQSARRELGVEGRVAIGTEWMAVRKSVTRRSLAGDDQYWARRAR